MPIQKEPSVTRLFVERNGWGRLAWWRTHLTPELPRKRSLRSAWSTQRVPGSHNKILSLKKKKLRGQRDCSAVTGAERESDLVPNTHSLQLPGSPVPGDQKPGSRGQALVTHVMHTHKAFIHIELKEQGQTGAKCV